MIAEVFGRRRMSKMVLYSGNRPLTRRALQYREDSCRRTPTPRRVGFAKPSESSGSLNRSPLYSGFFSSGSFFGGSFFGGGVAAFAGGVAGLGAAAGGRA